MTHRSFDLPVRAFRSCLSLYPATYRARFGSEMEQVFRTEWRDVSRRGSTVETLGFLARSILDLLQSAAREHLAGLRRPHPMNKPQTFAGRITWSLMGGFLVLVLIVGLVIAVTMALPETYMSSVRLRLATSTQRMDPHRLQTEMEVLRSSRILQDAASRAHLAERWSSRYLPQGTNGLQPTELAALLKNQLEVRAIRNTAMVEVRVYDRDKQLAADIANAIAASYLGFWTETEGAQDARPDILDAAEAGLRPVAPNVPANLFIGVLGGSGLGAIAAVLIWALLGSRHRQVAPK